MKRAVVFAHYDKNNQVDDYVIYYIQALKQIAQTIVFVSCNHIENPECLHGLADKIIDEPHNEYDFGSYKRGFLYLQDNLEDYDELIFANDSCYGPLYPLENVFSKMDNKKCDFWGITKNRFGLIKNNDKYKVIERPHIQSYFLVFNKNVFLSKVFADFINSIIHHEKKNDIIINYEIGLSETLQNAGFKSGSYIQVFYKFNHVMISFWKILVKKYKIPFIKRSILNNKHLTLTISDNWENIILLNSEYPISLIEKDIGKTNYKISKIRSIILLIKEYYFYFIGLLPPFLKQYFIKFNQFLISVKIL